MIDQYLRGELSEDEILDFKQRLSSDPQFKREYLQKWAIQANFRSKNLYKKLDLLNEIEQNEFRSFKNKQINLNKTTINLRRRIFYISSAAATVAILVFSYFSSFNKINPLDEVFMTQFESYPSSVIKRGAKTNLIQTRLLAYTYYEIGDYKNAAPILEEVAIGGDSKSFLYAGIAYSALNDYLKSNILLNKYLKENNEFKSVALMYLNINEMMLGETEKAIKGFEALSNIKGFVGKKSKAILKELKEIRK